MSADKWTVWTGVTVVALAVALMGAGGCQKQEQPAPEAAVEQAAEMEAPEAAAVEAPAMPEAGAVEVPEEPAAQPPKDHPAH